MPAKLLWLLIMFGPAIIVALLGMRALRVRKNEAWADFYDAAVVLRWFTAPMIVVVVPFLAKQSGFTSISAGFTGFFAILLFCILFAAFLPDEKPSAAQLIQRIAIGFGTELGIGIFLIFAPMAEYKLVPSVSLFILLMLASYLGIAVAGSFARVKYKSKLLGPGELFTRIREIAQHCGTELEYVILIKNAPGYSKFINASAMRGTQIAIFEDLINSLNKAEVDAVIEHEIGHIADERIWSIDQSLRYLCYITMLVIAYVAEQHIKAMHGQWFNLLYVMWGAMFILPEMLSRWYSRKIERKANKNVGIITDPVSVISGYYKLAVLNNHPISRPYWSRIISTHPYFDEEINAIARHANLSQEQVEQIFRNAEEEISSGSGEKYTIVDASLADVEDEAEANFVKRPGKGAGFWIAVLAVFVGVAFFVAGLSLGLSKLDKCADWVQITTVFITLIGSMFIILSIIEAGRRARLRRLGKKIQGSLTIKYGESAVSQSILVDAMFPGWIDYEHTWQGALLSVSDGKLTLLGEAAKLQIPLDYKINASRWADNNSSGSDAQIVLIAYEEEQALRMVFVKILGRPERGEPSNWKHLEKKISAMLKDAGANIVPKEDLVPGGKRKLKWSPRILIAAVIYIAILALADFLLRELAGNDLGNRLVVGFFVTSAVGSGLWNWISQVKKGKS